MKKEHPGEKFDANGTLYVGEKGILFTGTYGGPKLVGKREADLRDVPKSLPSPAALKAISSCACRDGKCDTATAFDYSSRLTEFTLLGNMAQYAGHGKLVLWDGPGMKVTSPPELNAWIDRPYRKGGRRGNGGRPVLQTKIAFRGSSSTKGYWTQCAANLAKTTLAKKTLLTTGITPPIFIFE